MLFNVRNYRLALIYIKCCHRRVSKLIACSTETRGVASVANKKIYNNIICVCILIYILLPSFEL